MSYDKKLLFKIPYGMYVVTSEFEGVNAGCIINTFSQMADKPEIFVASVEVSTHTASIMNKSKVCIINALDINTKIDIIDHFGMKSGFNINKFSNEYSDIFDYKTHKATNIPYIRTNTVFSAVCNIVSITNVGTHYVYILELVDFIPNNVNNDIITYSKYRDIRYGKKAKHVCTVCHYTYDGEIDFDDLDDDYRCPVCGSSKEAFVLVE